MAQALAGSRLQRLAREAASRSLSGARERCDLCAQDLATGHRHLLDLGEGTRRLLCACRACAVLFDQREGRRYRLVPQRCRRLQGFRLEDTGWDALGVPVALAFFVPTGAGIAAFCPSAIGTMTVAVDAASWARLQGDNAVLAGLEPEVEALLVNRARGAREHWLAPIDVCYRLAAVVRTHWRGLGGGPEVWAEIGRFFEALAGKGDR